MDISSISVEPNTDAAPLTANPQSIRSPTILPAFAKGIPMKNPKGATNIIVTNILGTSSSPDKEYVKGFNIKISSMIQTRIAGKIKFIENLSEYLLPIPEKRSRVNNTVIVE